jgi:CBS domain containing-hemolysin-like protein
MDLISALGLLSVLGLVLANGFFVACEFAMVAVRRSRLDQLAEEGRAGARTAKAIVGELDAYIAACQLGITMASLALGWIGEPALAGVLEAPLSTIFGDAGKAASHGVAVAIAFSIITAMHIVIGELAPKGLALQRPEATVLVISRPLRAFYLVFRWPISFLNAVGNRALSVFGLDPAGGPELAHSVAELQLLVTSSQVAGVVEESEAAIARRAFEFADLTASALMTPRTEIEAVPVEVSRQEMLAVAARSHHHRVLVYRGSIDTVVGVVHFRDLFATIAVADAQLVLAPPLVRPVMSVPETKRADDLLEEMRIASQHFAVVIDEYGGTAGVITLENLLEGLVGRIEPEPNIGEMPTPIDYEPEPDGSFVLDGMLRLDEFEEISGLRLESTWHDEVETLGGLTMLLLDRIPDVGDELIVDGRTLRVEVLDGRRVETVRLLPPAGGRTGIPA